MKKKDQEAIAKLYTEAFDDYGGGHNGSTDGGQYDDEPENPTSTLKNIINGLQSYLQDYKNNFPGYPHPLDHKHFLEYLENTVIPTLKNIEGS